MTDLERARWLLPDGTDEVEVRELAGALAAARREGAEEMEARLRSSVLFEVGRQQGAEEMRERAAQHIEEMPIAYALGVARAIRALPLTAEEPT